MKSAEHDSEFAQDVEARVRQIRIQEEARRRVQSGNVGEGFTFPDTGLTLTDDLAMPTRARAFSIDELHPTGGNTLLVAQYKAGKTTLLMNLVKSLADGTPLFGRFDVKELSGRVAFWNYELDDDMFRSWIRDIGIENTNKVAMPLHLRGRTLRLWEPDVAAEAVAWLKESEVEFLILDPAARSWRGLVTDENDNAQIAQFTDALDTIKREAGVPDMVLATHMGRATFDEGGERARGATRLEDWMDAGWYLSVDKSGARAFRASGRDVNLDAIDLQFEPTQRTLVATGMTRSERRIDDGIQDVVDALEIAGDDITTSALESAMSGAKEGRSAAIHAAIEQGYVERTYVDGAPVDESARKTGVKLLCRLTDRGRDRSSRRVHRVAGPSKGRPEGEATP